MQAKELRAAQAGKHQLARHTRPYCFCCPRRRPPPYTTHSTKLLCGQRTAAPLAVTSTETRHTHTDANAKALAPRRLHGEPGLQHRRTCRQPMRFRVTGDLSKPKQDGCGMQGFRTACSGGTSDACACRPEGHLRFKSGARDPLRMLLLTQRVERTMYTRHAAHTPRLQQ